MFELEIIRVLFVVGILSINSIYDLKYRTIAGSDKKNFLVGLIGFSILLLDTYDTSFSSELLMMVICMTVVFLLWRFKIVASGDIVIALILCAVLPINLIPITTIFIALILSIIVTLSYNIVLNTSTKRNKEKLFHDFNSSIFIKAIVFVMAHKKRSWEKYVLSIEDNRKLSLMASPFDKEFETKNGTIVSNALPLVPFMLLGFPIALLITPMVMNYLAFYLSYLGMILS